jgi:hypothetical protein
MNGHAPLQKSFLELACACRQGRVVGDSKERGSRNESCYLPEIFCFIRGDSNGAVDSERGVQHGEKPFAHQAARGVATFRPGVRKHNMKCRHRTRRQEPLHRIRDFEAQYPRIR